ncbi:MAG: tRNA (adenine-N1)-methyltransferase, partial [Pontimonas sp.]
LCWARTLAPGTSLPVRAGRKVKPDYLDADVEMWTPGAIAQRTETAKKIRQLTRDSSARAAKARRDSPQTMAADASSDAQNIDADGSLGQLE